jgi:hypothetical protein
MEILNAPLRAIFGAVLAPFAARSPMWTLVPISVVVGVLALLVFKVTSNQPALAASRERQFAGFFEIRLFNDDLVNIFRAQGRILKATGAYLLRILVPLAVLMPVLILVIAQLQFHYGYEGLRPGEPTLVRARLDTRTLATAGKPSAILRAPAGVRVETPAVWIPSERILVWRVRATRPGDYEMQLSVGGTHVTKSLTVSDRIVRRSPVRPGRSVITQLFHPAEPPLPGDGPVESFEVNYPAASVNLAGWHTNWLIAFFILSLVAALALRRPLRVTI